METHLRPLRFPVYLGACRTILCTGIKPCLRCLNTDCLRLFCYDCDAVHACKHCGIPFCHQCRHGHEVECGKLAHEEGYEPLSATCGACGSFKAYDSWWDCQSCGSPQCSNEQCRSQVLTTDCCHLDICDFCTVQISRPEFERRFPGKSNTVRCLCCDGCLNGHAGFNHSSRSAPFTVPR